MASGRWQKRLGNFVRRLTSLGRGKRRRSRKARRKARRDLILRATQLAALGLFAALVVTVGQVAHLAEHNPEETAFTRLRQREAEREGRRLKIDLRWRDYGQISDPMKRAVVVAEDIRFWTHFGIDPAAILEAARRNERSGRIKVGGSTITQQLAKNLYLSPRRTYLRKAREAVIAVVMEVLLSKRRILEIYLNVIELGPGQFGVEAGARHHFGTSASRLSLMQACRLASIIPAPLRYEIRGDYVTRRATRLKELIVERGMGRPRAQGAEGREPGVQRALACTGGRSTQPARGFSPPRLRSRHTLTARGW